MSSFQDIIADHNATVTELNKELDQSRANFTIAVEQLTASTLSDISVTSKKTYATQKQIEQSSAQLLEQTQGVLHQTKEWANSLKDFNNSVKELGDIANWCKVIESDMTFIAKALDNTCVMTNNKQQQQPQGK